MRDNDPPTSDGQIRCVPSRKITPDGRFEDLHPPSTNGRGLSRIGYLIGRAPRGRADLVPGTRPISGGRQKVDGAPLRGTRWEQTRRGRVGQKSYYATLDPYLKGKFHRPPVWRFALSKRTRWCSVASRAVCGNGVWALVGYTVEQSPLLPTCAESAVPRFGDRAKNKPGWRAQVQKVSTLVRSIPNVLRRTGAPRGCMRESFARPPPPSYIEI